MLCMWDKCGANTSMVTSSMNKLEPDISVEHSIDLWRQSSVLVVDGQCSVCFLVYPLPAGGCTPASVNDLQRSGSVPRNIDSGN